MEEVGGGAYVVGASLLMLGSGAARRQALEGRLQNTLAELRDAVGAAVYLSRYTDGEVSVVQVADGPLTPAVNEWVDFRSAAHASAAGKCLLAQLDHDARRDHVSRHRLKPGSPPGRSPTRRSSSPSSTPRRPRSRCWTSRSTRWAPSARPCR